MNRRKFLKWLGVVAPAAVVCVDPWCGSIAGEGIIPHDELHNFVPEQPQCLLEYADYSNFSAFALAKSWNEMIDNVATELSYQAGLSVRDLLRAAA